LEDDENPGSPSTLKTEENIMKISKHFQKDRRLSIRMIAEIRKVCAKAVPKNLTQEQKDNPINIYSNIMERITEQPDVLENIIACDETI
jgi:hypothetical protein